MSRLRLPLLGAIAASLLAAHPAEAAIPRVLTYSGNVKTAAGAPVTAPTDLTFRLYTGATGGAAAWTEAVSVTPTSDGWFSAVLGTTTPLVLSTFDQDLYLSLQVGTDPELTPRARVTPSGSALVVDWSGVQGKPTCAAGQYLTLDASSNLVCTTPAAGTGGGVTGVTATAPVVSSGGTAPVISMAANPNFSGTVTATTFAGSLSGNASTATTASGVAANAVTPSNLNTRTAPVAGQVPSRDASDTFTWISPVTTVTANAPLAVAGSAATPVLSIGQASASTSGSLSAADFGAFSSKQAAITGGPCAAGAYVTNVDATTGAVTCAPGPAFKVTNTVGKKAIAATGATAITSIVFTAPSAGMVLVTGSGYCSLTTGAAASYRTLIGTSTVDEGSCTYGFYWCIGGVCEVYYCGFHDFPAAATPRTHTFFAQRVFGVAAGTNTFYLNAVANSAGPVDCSGQLTATFQASGLP